MHLTGLWYKKQWILLLPEFCGSWCFVATKDSVENMKELKKCHDTQQKKLAKKDCQPFVTPPYNISKNARFIIYKNSKLVILYTNNLHHMLKEDMYEGTHEEAVAAVHRQDPLKQWTGSETLGQTAFYAPAPIVAYNVFINFVDVMGQQCSTNAAQHKKKRLNMSIFTLIFDLVIDNAYELHSWLVDKDKVQPISYRKFSFFLCFF